MLRLHFGFAIYWGRGRIIVRYFRVKIGTEIWRQIAPGTYFYLWGRIAPPRKAKLQNRSQSPKKIAVWNRLLSVWKRMESFGIGSKRIAEGWSD